MRYLNNKQILLSQMFNKKICNESFQPNICVPTTTTTRTKNMNFIYCVLLRFLIY